MKVSFVRFEAKEKAVLLTEDFDPSLQPNEILVKADYDLISAGTELANYHDLPNTNVFSDDRGKFPRHPGYSVSGHVTAVGSGVTKFKVGDNVMVPWSGHRSWFKKEEDKLFLIPEGVSQQEGAVAHLASFSFLGVRKLQIQLGESVMVAGLGLLGLIAVQIAKLSGGYPVLACDFSEERRKLALELGADYALDPREPDFIEKVKSLTDGKGPNAVVEVTGYLSGLQQALEYIAPMGRISILGCTRISDAPINVYRYIHGRGIQIIGAHTMTRPKHESYPGYWTEKDDYATFMKLVKAGVLNVKPLINKVVSPRQTPEVYEELGFSKQPPLGVLFDWTDFE